MAIVVFVPADFKAAYPEFTSVSDARCTMLFTIAQGALLDNTGGSPVCDVTYRTQLFYMLVAHLLLIFGTSDTPTADNAPPGRISSATEGTVTSSFEYILPAGSAMQAWFNQTKYGAMYWMATAPYRSARYFANGSSGVGFAQAYGSVPFNVPGGI